MWNLHQSGRRRPPVIVLVVVVAWAAVVAIASRMDDEADPKERSSPSSSAICDIAPDDGDEAINAAIADCPDGSTVRFPKDKTYRQDGPIRIDDRHNLTIDGNGSTFITNSSSRSAGMGNFTILRGTNVTFERIVARGAFNLRPIDGKYSLGQYPAGVGWETNPGFGFFGTKGGGVRDSQVYDVWGDGVQLSFDGIIDQAVRCNPVDGCFWQVSEDLVVEGILVDNASRVAIGPTNQKNGIVRDSIFRNSWTWGIDAEADAYPTDQTDLNGPGQGLHNALPLDGLKILNNTFEGYNFGAIAVPAGGDFDTVVGNIEIRGNRILTPQTQNTSCAPPVLVGIDVYSGTRRIVNVAVEENEIHYVSLAVEFNHVDGGSIRNNTLVFKDPGLFRGPPLQCTNDQGPIKVDPDVTGVAVEGH